MTKTDDHTEAGRAKAAPGDVGVCPGHPRFSDGRREAHPAPCAAEGGRPDGPLILAHGKPLDGL